MNIVLRWLTQSLASIVVLAVVLAAVVVVYSSVSQWRINTAMRIETQNGIRSLESVALGGIAERLEFHHAQS